MADDQVNIEQQIAQDPVPPAQNVAPNPNAELANVFDRLVNQNSLLDLRNALIRQTSPCDGQERSRFRVWLHELDLAHRNAPELATFIAMRTALGSLRTEVERAADLWKHEDADRAADINIKRQDAPWPAMAAHLTTIFLGGEEQERRRAELNQLTQHAYETVPTYIIRFQEAADHAYPQPRNEVHDVMLRDIFLRGLTDEKLCRRVITRPNVNTFQNAVQTVTQMADASDRYTRLMAAKFPKQTMSSNPTFGQTKPRLEEPMEVNHIKQQADLDKICSAIQNLEAKVSAISFQNQPQSNPNRQSQPGNFKPKKQQQITRYGGGFTPRHSGTIPNSARGNEITDQIARQTKICFYCNKPGHIRRNCFQLQHRQQQPPF